MMRFKNDEIQPRMNIDYVNSFVYSITLLYNYTIRSYSLISLLNFIMFKQCITLLILLVLRDNDVYIEQC